MKIGYEFLYLSEADVYAVGTTMKQHVDVVEQGLRLLHKGDVQLPGTSELHFPGDAAIRSMPAAIKSTGAVGHKWMTVFWKNPERGMSYLQGFVVLNDPETGAPVCMMDAKSLTGYRTAAINGVAVRHLANKDAAVVGVIACGLQARTNLEAVLGEAPHVERVVVWGRNPQRLAQYCDEMSAKFGLPVTPVASVREVAEQADILSINAPAHYTVGDSNREIEAGWLKKGCTIVPVNMDTQFKHGAIAQAVDRIYIDDERKWNMMKDHGAYQGVEHIPPTLGSLLEGDTEGRQSHDEIVATFHTGIALLDVASGHMVYEQALQKGVGTILPL